MTLEQMQQITPWTIISEQPWWVILIYLILIAGALACAVCLPLIVWRLWNGNNPRAQKGKQIPLQPGVLERQARRVAIRKIVDETHRKDEQPVPEAASDFSASGA